MPVVVLTVVLVLSVIYWAVTALYLLPPNPLRDRFSAELDGFGEIASQRWGFFAPPPQSNRRLYYAFFDANGAEKVRFEVLEPITRAKREQAPFNTGEEIMDYIVSGAEDQIAKHVGRQQTAQKKGAAIAAVITATVPADIDLPALRTLKTYAKYVAQRNNVAADVRFVTITCTAIAIPPLEAQAQVDKTEKLVFRTTMFRLAGS